MDTETITMRIAKLLAKAERTDNTAEAEAFISKAQSLMTQHAIDEIMVMGVDLGSRRDEIETREMEVSAPYEKAKLNLWTAVARANDCKIAQRMTSNHGTTKFWITGFTSDVDAVVAMVNSLSIHCTREMLKATKPSGVNTKSFRHGFQIGYAWRMHDRLMESRKMIVDDTPGVGLVLVEKEGMVNDAFGGFHGKVKTFRSSAGDSSGRGAGRDAANRAEINKGVGGNTHALNG